MPHITYITRAPQASDDRLTSSVLQSSRWGRPLNPGHLADDY